jgi:hypothetical protein
MELFLSRIFTSMSAGRQQQPAAKKLLLMSK